MHGQCCGSAATLQMLWDIIQTGHYNFSVEVQNDGLSEALGSGGGG